MDTQAAEHAHEDDMQSAEHANAVKVAKATPKPAAKPESKKK
jgi:hypothetical protein